MECFQGSYCLATRELRSLSKASAKVRQFFKLQNFFASFFSRNFAVFRHCAEHQHVEHEKNFQLFLKQFRRYASETLLYPGGTQKSISFFLLNKHKIHKTCYKKKIVPKITLTLQPNYTTQNKKSRQARYI